MTLTRGAALKMPPGEPLFVALTRAAGANGARHVHSLDEGKTWHTHDALPRGVAVYFRVSGGKIWIRTADKVEYLVATVKAGQIALEPNAAKLFASALGTV